MAAKLASTKDIRALFHHKPDISRAQIDALFEKHDSSVSRSITCLESNCTNQVFMIETHSHGDVILKIQFRRVHGFSLKTEFIATKALRGAAGVPVSESLVYDGDGEPLGFECLLIPREPGESGISCYLAASRAQRLQLGALLGQTVAHVHSQQCPDELLSQTQRDLTSWEETIREALLGEEEFGFFRSGNFAGTFREAISCYGFIAQNQGTWRKRPPMGRSRTAQRARRER